jgi:hypothetical protein
MTRRVNSLYSSNIYGCTYKGMFMSDPLANCDIETDHADEAILTAEIPDAALEEAAGIGTAAVTVPWITFPYARCCSTSVFDV